MLLFMIVPYLFDDGGKHWSVLLQISGGFSLFCFILFCIENWRWLFPNDGK